MNEGVQFGAGRGRSRPPYRAAVRVLCLVSVALCALAAIVVAASAEAAPGGAEAGCPPSWGSRVNPPPSVTIDTNARGGTGIAITGPTPLIGECYPGANAFYPGAADKWLHVVVVKRKDLAPVLNMSFDCPEATTYPSPHHEERISHCIGEVKSELAKYEDRDHTNLVIATSQYDGKNQTVQPPVGMFAALGPALSISSWNWWEPSQEVRRGTYTAIGVPGEPGLGRELIGGQLAPGSARMVDNLVRDNQGNYGLVSGQRLAFDTRAPGSSKAVNIIQVGDQRFQQDCTRRVRESFQVVILDAQTLEGKSYFPQDGWRGLATVLSDANRAARAPYSRPKLVFIATCGEAPDLGLDGLKEAADEITQTGGTRSRFMDVAWHAKPYTLVGRAGLAAGLGDEAGRPVQGTLARLGPYYNYQVETANPLSQASSGDLLTGTTQLLQTIGRKSSDWPEVADAHGNPPPRAANKAAAIAYISEKEFDNTPDPRTQYWTYPWGTGAPTHWQNVESAIRKLAPPSGEKFNDQDFAWAQDELQKEIEWLIDEHTYMEQRAKPFYSHVLESWAGLQEIASQVDHEVQAPDKTAEARAGAILNFALDIGEEIPVVGKAVGASAAAYKLVTEYDKAGNEPLESPFPVKASEVGKKLAERMSLAQDALTTDVPNAIAADYQKLKTVGECVDNTAPDHSECPFKPKDWQFTPDDQKEAAEGLKKSSMVAVYGALLPVKYQVWKLPPSRHEKANENFSGRATFACFYPFEHEPATGQIAIPLGEHPATTDYQISALGFLTGTGVIDNRWEMHTPEASVTNPLFGNGAGELGINQEQFFSRFFSSTSELTHYPERDTPTGWDVFLCHS